MKLSFKRYTRTGSALLTVLLIATITLMILASTLRRTYTVANLNDRSSDLIVCQNAAEAAVESVFSRMQTDFQTVGPALVKLRLDGEWYRKYHPGKNTVDTPRSDYWDQFVFSDAQNQDNSTFIQRIGTYTGPLPQAYPGRTTTKAPMYRILSNARLRNGASDIVGTAQLDVLLALVPLTQYSIFYNGLLEFSTCAEMEVNGPVHCNTNLYVGTGAKLTFNSTVTSSAKITSPGYTFPGNTSFKGVPPKVENVPTVATSINMSDTYSLLTVPTVPDATTDFGKQRLYNQAQVVLLVKDTTVTAIIQKAPGLDAVPGADPSPLMLTANFTKSPANYADVAAKFPFLTLTSTFYDRRESKTNITTQIDVAKYNTWLGANSAVTTKYPGDGSSGYPTILYVADQRTVLNKQITSVRLNNGIAPPPNGGLGFSVATPNPLYVWGNYNQTVPALLNTANTSSGTVPCALMSDALTILSSSWQDSKSTSSYTTRAAADTTVNAAILTGVVPSTGTFTKSSDFQNGKFSGGVHNLTRLLEDWGSKQLTLNTSIISLFSSRAATNQFIWPGTYYDPPTRKFSYDLNFKDPEKTPPGIPCALVALRFNWNTPPPNNISYNALP